MTLKAIDLFGGIGGFRLGLQQSDLDIEFIEYYDQDKFAVKSYNEIFGETHEPTDITTVDDQRIPNHDLLCAGFPCQSFSIAGRREGFDDTRGTLFFEIARIAKARKPAYLLLENVKGLLSHDDGETFKVMLETLGELGYDVEWQVCNSRLHGVPQNRERVFIVGHLDREPGRHVFPIRPETERDTGKDTGKETSGVTHPTFTARNYEKMGQAGGYLGSIEAVAKAEKPIVVNNHTRSKERPSISDEGRAGGSGILFTDEYSYALESSPHFVKNPIAVKGDLIEYKNPKRQNGISDEMFTLRDAVTHGVRNYCGIRKLTPKECWRLQGFPDWAFDKAAEVNSDTQLYKQAGNAVTVNVVKTIGDKMADVLQKSRDSR